LAIIDIGESGVQPMSFGAERFWITYNGEIYNYLELREELASKGVRFITGSDTEVILAAYSVWKHDALAKLRGMFAFALYDRHEAKLFLARDRFGIKPLYFTRNAHGFAAGSEIKQLLPLSGVTPRINPRRAYDYLAGGLSDQSADTLFADVSQLLPGTWMEIDLPSRTFRQGEWYKLPPAGTIHLSAEDASARFLDLLQESVRFHIRADVEVGSCLSGGLDSSALVTLMAKHLESQHGGHRQNTVTACFEGTHVDETCYADAVREATGVRAHAVRPRAEDIMQDVRRIVWHQDEPYGSLSIHAQYHVFAEARANNLKVMLDGQGADEILAGYHGVYDLQLAHLLKSWRMVAALRLAAQRKAMLGVPLRSQAQGAAQELSRFGNAPVRATLGLGARLRRKMRSACGISTEPWLEADAFGISGNHDVFGRAFSDASMEPPTDIASLCVGMATAGNLRMLLHWEDRNSMAHGVEARVPFLDHPLVEFAIGLGSDHKLVDGWTKWILRDAMKDKLPDFVRLRRDKLGFATPEAVWMRGPLRNEIAAAIEDTQRRFPEQFRTGATAAMAADMFEGRRPVDFSLWRLACFGIWAECFGATF
jgi:asparagine synthase (glutamine-hydrolysing)